MELIRPPALRPGGTVGIIALASPCDPSRLKLGIDRIQKLGFKTKSVLSPAAAYGKSTYLFSSDTAENRANAFARLLKDDEVDVIFAARGAYGSIELLPFIDFELLRNNPKCLVGLSDITAFLMAAYAKARIASVHGAMVSGTFANQEQSENRERTIGSVIDLVTARSSNPLAGATFENIGSATEAEGVLLGGSLTALTLLLGTPWDYSLDGAILFIEDVGEKPFRVLRMLTQLQLSGKFKKLSGVLVGEFKDCAHAHGPDVRAVITQLFAPYKIPVLWGVPFGHGDLNIALPVGVNAKIRDNRVEIKDTVVLG